MKRFPILSTALAATISLAACSSGGADEVAPTTIAPTVATTSTSSTTSVTTTTTTTQAPTTTTPQWTPEELAVIDAYGRFQAEYAAALASSDSDLGLLASLSTSDFGAGLVKGVGELRSSDVVFTGDFEFTTSVVRFLDGETAEIDTCEWDRTVQVDSGEIVDEPDPSPLSNTSGLKLVGGRWLVDGLGYGPPQNGDSACVL